MGISKSVAIVLLCVLLGSCIPVSAGHHHVYYRIHVPQKIKTVYHTKIIKVPEHHHYIHEKTKVVKVEEPHHEEWEKPKLLKVESSHHDDWEDIKDTDWAHSENHNVYRAKNSKTTSSAPRRKSHKRRKIHYE